ncbi:MAG TPA: hypothetical protein VK154_00275 [Chitinophagales bacterium]|nr:hypothetical protein [Chitinophagales bacterium]
MKLALVTCAAQPCLTESDRPLVTLFKQHGIHAEPVIWNDAGIEWNKFSAVLIRSVWDYHLHQAAFNQWLSMLEANRIYTLNPVNTIKGNQNKLYLQQLQQAGVEIIPTIFLPKTTDLDLSEIKARGWTKAVIKPAVSASAYLSRVFNADEIAAVENEYKPVALKCELLVQPFVNEVKQQGEISLVYFNRSFSHAVLKVPQAHDFRVQQEYGGITTPYEPDKSVLSTAGKILTLIDDELLYARVDGVLVDGRFVLMELELIEPYLFFDYSTGSMQQFVGHAVQLIKNHVLL